MNRQKEKKNEDVGITGKLSGGGIEKKLYWTLMRENFMHILPEIQEILRNNDECKSIHICKDGCILEKESGLRLFFHFSESISRAEIDLLNKQDPEKQNMEFVKAFLSNNDCRAVFDIGANVGMFSLELYQNHRNIDYYLFEPIPTTYQRLVKTTELNQADEERVHTYNIGMSNQKGTFDFYLPGESEAASLKPVDDVFYRKKSDKFGRYTGSVEMERITCQVSTVDDFVVENGIEDIGFLKIDVEGNEKFVLEGARETLVRFQPLVYSELLRKHAKRFGYHPNDVIDFMKDIGYKCAIVYKNKLMPIEEITDSTEETNFFFLYEGKHR